jgi:hypothetical protein
MRLLNRGIKDRYVVINQKKDQVIYLPQGKERKLSNPEEQVQLETYLDLIYSYGYPPEQVRVCERMQIGSSSREADIVVYRDRDCKDPYIIVECKKRNISNSIFESSIDQGFSYAAVSHAEYVWATSGDRNAMFEVRHKTIQERESNRVSQLPRYRGQNKAGESVFRRAWRWLLNHPLLSDTLLYAVVLLLLTLIASKLTVEFFPQIYRATEWLWEKHGMDFNWLFNAIVVVASLFSLLFGLIFMRSHKLFRFSQGRKWMTFLMIALILFLPSWYVGESMGNPDWWKWINYNQYVNKGYPIMIYLWPYVKSIPFQIAAIFGLIWLMSRFQRD